MREKKDFSASFSEEICRSTQDFEASVIVLNGYNHDLSPIDIEGVNEPFKASVVDATEGLFEVFTFNLIEGDTAAIHDPNNVFIPLSLAKKLFGESGPYVGRRFGEKKRGQSENFVASLCAKGNYINNRIFRLPLIL